MNEFKLIALTLPGLADPAIAIAASRAGCLGILDLSYTPFEKAQKAILKLSRYSRNDSGLRVESTDTRLLDFIYSDLPANIRTILLTFPSSKVQVEALQNQGVEVCSFGLEKGPREFILELGLGK